MLTVGDEYVAEKAATVISLGDFRDENGSNASQSTGPDSSEHTCTNDEVEVLCCRLQSAADQAKKGSVKETIDATDPIC